MQRRMKQVKIELGCESTNREKKPKKYFKLKAFLKPN